jgi:NAD-dependent dihydropyrimidine dehydrogenase PreA subunit
MKYLKNVATLQHDMEKCVGCGICLEVCPHRVFQPMNGKVILADRDSCMECGACMRNCPFGAIQVEKGVGCAAAIIMSFFSGEKPSCG